VAAGDSAGCPATARSCAQTPQQPTCTVWACSCVCHLHSYHPHLCYARMHSCRALFPQLVRVIRELAAFVNCSPQVGHSSAGAVGSAAFGGASQLKLELQFGSVCTLRPEQEDCTQGQRHSSPKGGHRQRWRRHHLLKGVHSLPEARVWVALPCTCWRSSSPFALQPTQCDAMLHRCARRTWCCCQTPRRGSTQSSAAWHAC
jgi:hypothetical protein